jgi:hypothetical protein
MPSLKVTAGFLVFWSSCVHLSAAERITVELQVSEGVVCNVVNTSRPWTVPPHNPSYTYPGIKEGSFSWWGADFELRQGKRLLISVFTDSGLYQGKPTARLDSLDRYAVISENGKLALAPAAEEDWQAARILSHSKQMSGAAKTPRDGQPLDFLNHLFIPSGRHWWNPITFTYLSPDSSAIALLSWDGTVHLPEPYGSPRYNGRYFIDLYHVPSARRLALIRGRFQDVSPEFATLAFWIEGSRYVLPISKDMSRFVICETQ